MLDFLKKHIWIVIIIVALLLIPQSFLSQSELNGRVLITGIAVDSIEDDYKVTAQVILPSGEKEGANVILNFVSAVSSSVTEAIDMITAKLGMTTGLSHLNFILIGRDLYENKNVMSVMDVFMRDERISNSVSFYCTRESAEEEIKKTKNLNLSTAIGIENVFTKKEEALSAVVTPVYKFVSDGLSDTKAQMVSGLSITEENGEENKNSDTNKSNNTSRLTYLNNIYVFKEGNLIHEIKDEESIIGAFLLNKASSQGIITVKNVNDDTFKNANVSVHIKNKKVKYNAKFVDNIPVLTIKISAVNNAIREIHNENLDENNYFANKNYFTEALKNTLTESIIFNIDRVITETKDIIDLFGFEASFKAYHPIQYKKYKEIYGDDFFNKIQINYEIKLSANE